MVLPTSDVDREIMIDLVDLFSSESDLSIALTEDPLPGEAALDAVLDGSADIALVSNALPYRDGITTIVPLFPTVLHIGYVGERDVSSAETLLRGAGIFAGEEGSASRLIFEKATAQFDLGADAFNFISDPDEIQPDVFVVFAPIAPDRLREFQARVNIRLFSTGRPEDVGTGSSIDAATLLNPYLKPFVIPVGTYGEATPEPILTVAVDKMLVARRDLDPSSIYTFVSELLRLRPALAAKRPGLFKDLTDNFDASRSTFVLHPGAQAYIERSEPTFLERYSGVAEVAVTVFIGLVSAIFGGLRIYDRKRKNRIDRFYSEALVIRDSTLSSSESRESAIVKIQSLQDEAFEQLVDEKLAADESFRIFLSLTNNIMRQLGAQSGPTTLSDD